VTWLTDRLPIDGRFDCLEKACDTEHQLCMSMPGNPPFSAALMIQMYLVMCETFPAASVFEWSVENQRVLMGVDKKVVCSVLSSSGGPRRAGYTRILYHLKAMLQEPAARDTKIVILSKGCGTALWEREFAELSKEEGVDLKDVQLVSVDMVAWDGTGGKVLQVHPDSQVWPEPKALITTVSLSLFRAPPKQTYAIVRSLMADTMDGGYIICSEDLAAKKAMALLKECVLILQEHGLAKFVEDSEVGAILVLTLKKERCQDKAAAEVAYAAAEARVNEIVDRRTTSLLVDTCGGKKMKIVDHDGKRFRAKNSGLYVIQYDGPDEGHPPRDRLVGMPSSYLGGSRSPAFRSIESMLERTFRCGFKGKKWRAFFRWHIGRLDSSTRDLPLTIRHLDLIVHVAETIDLALSFEGYNINFSQSGLTSAYSLGSLLGGAFTGGFNLHTYENRKKIITTWPDITQVCKEELLLSLKYQADVAGIFQGSYGKVLGTQLTAILQLPVEPAEKARLSTGAVIVDYYSRQRGKSFAAQEAALEEGPLADLSPAKRRKMLVTAAKIAPTTKHEAQCRTASARSETEIAVASTMSATLAARYTKVLSASEVAAQAALTALLNLAPRIGITNMPKGDDFRTAPKPEYHPAVSTWWTHTTAVERAKRIAHYLALGNPEFGRLAKVLEKSTALWRSEEDALKNAKPGMAEAKAASQQRKKCEHNKQKRDCVVRIVSTANINLTI
jgi:hypothetical protein